ncbi:hypothetical protein TcG_10441 [Trypanosoma cruzi]|nr:hypothetical protein TcG_10441 [Trypanosoma cruzi]
MRQLFSAPFQCHIFLLIDGRHSVRRATLIGLCGTARQRHRRKQADFFTYLIAILRAGVFHMFCWALKQRGVRNYACVELFLPCELRATPRGCQFDSAELLCIFCGAGREVPCSQLLLVCPQMMSLHANNVLQRVRVLIGFACTLIVLAALCGHATLEWWENGAGRCMAASRPSFTARWGGVHCGVLSADVLLSS